MRGIQSTFIGVATYCGFALTFANLTFLTATEPPREGLEPPKKFAVFRDVRPHPLLIHGWEGIVNGVSVVGGKDRGAVWLFPDGFKDAFWLPNADRDGYRPRFSVFVGDLVPLGGTIYRVTEISDSPHKVEFQRAAPSEIPTGVTVQADSYVFPYRTPYCDLYLVPVYFFDVVEGKPLAATIAITANLKKENDGSQVLAPGVKSQTVRVGDTLMIIGKEEIHGEYVPTEPRFHKVRNIVPPNPKRHVVGWVELDAKRLTEEEVNRDKQRSPDVPDSQNR